MLTRRDLLRSTALATLAVAGGSLLTACGGGGGPGSASVKESDGDRLVASDVSRSAGRVSAVAGVVAAMARFGGGLLDSVGRGSSGNLALSPYSAAVALAMTTNGAAGSTGQQLLDLFPGVDLADLNAGLAALTAYAESLSGPVERADGAKAALTLAAANSLFGQRGEGWRRPFLDTLARYYGAGMRTVDYRDDAPGATAAINQWTADHTADKITDLIPPGTLDSTTRLVLVDALYFAAPWESPFEKGRTTTGGFTRADGSTVQTALMHADAESGPTMLGRGDGWAATRLPYAGRRLAMTIVLPDAGRFDEVWGEVVAGRLATYLSSLRSGAAVDLTLPRFTFRTRAELIRALESLGVTLAFTPGADFSPMTGTEALQIAEVLQQVYVAVDEAGTVAAAATAVAMGVSATRVSGDPYAFVADRPFVFAIHDVEHDTPLFVGRVTDPTAS